MFGLGSVGTLGIGMVVRLRDEFSAKSNTIAASMMKMHSNALQVTKANLNMMGQIGIGMAGAGLVMTMGFRNATKAAAEFQNTLISLKAMAGDMSDNEMKQLGTVAFDLSKKYAFGPNTIAKGMEELVKAGSKMRDIPKVMEAALASSLAAGEPLEGMEGTSARLVDIMMAWQVPAKGAMHVADLMSKTAIESTVSWGQLAESMKYSQDILHNLKIPMEDALALMGLLGNAGIKASIAGTSIGNMWREITEAAGGSSKKKTKALATLGLSPADLRQTNGDLKPMVALLDTIASKTAKLNTVDKQNILQTLFGTRGKRGANPAMDRLVDQLDKVGSANPMGHSLTEFRDLLYGKETQGSVLRMSQEKMGSYANQVILFSNAWERLKISMGSALIPILLPLMQRLTSILGVLERFVKTPVGKFFIGMIATIGAVMIPLGGFLMLTRFIGTAMLSNIGTLKSVGMVLKMVWANGIAQSANFLLNLLKIKAIMPVAGRWPAGTPGGIGGRFAPKGGIMIGGRMLVMETFGAMLAKGVMGLGIFAAVIITAGSFLRTLGITFGTVGKLIYNMAASLVNVVLNIIDLISYPFRALMGDFKLSHFTDRYGMNYKGDLLQPTKSAFIQNKGSYEGNDSDNMLKYINKGKDNPGKPTSTINVIIPGLDKVFTARIMDHDENEVYARFGLT